MVQLKTQQTSLPRKCSWPARAPHLASAASDDAPEPSPRTMQPPPRNGTPLPSDVLQRLRSTVW